MNERKEMAQDTDTVEDREVAQVTRPSLDEAGLRKDSQGRRTEICPAAGAFQTRPGASPRPPQPTRDRGVRVAKDRNFHDLFYTHAHTHMRAVEGFPAAPENIPRQMLFPRPPQPAPRPRRTQFPFKVLSVHLRCCFFATKF